MSRIFVTGDVHGNPMGKSEGKARIGMKKWPEQKNLTDDDFLIFLGDFGVIWENRPDRTEEYMIKWLDKKNFTSIVIGGNHENWNRLRSLPTEQRWGTEVGIIGYRTFFIPNGSILTLGDKKIFCMGGAMSTDKHRRKEGVDWWPGEEPTLAEMNRGVELLEDLDWEIDYVISHTMPSNSVEYFNNKLGYHFDRIADPTARYLQFISDHLKRCDGWFCGHFHQDDNFPDIGNGHNVRCVFHDVLEINVPWEERRF